MQYRGLPCMQGASMQCRGLPRSAWGFHAVHVASPQLHVLSSESSQLATHDWFQALEAVWTRNLFHLF